MRSDLAYFSKHPGEIEEQLKRLDSEWDTERLLEFGSSTVSILGLTLGLVHSRKWLFVPSAVQLFFLQHGIQGWCPPLPFLRRFGVRTPGEIETEREALRALRGDTEVDQIISRFEFTI